MEQMNFVKNVKELYPDSFNRKKVLEVGSYDVNGTVRPFFNSCDYIGIDVASGPGVDMVCSGQDFKDSTGFDTIITCEMMEHNPFWKETFINMLNMLHPGGLFILTCATTGRGEHGTLRTSPSQSPSSSSYGDYYQNLTESDFRSVLDFDSVFDRYEFRFKKSGIYLYGIKKLNKTSRKKFIIFTPPYTSRSAGIIALHRLAAELQIRNETVITCVTPDAFNKSSLPILQYPNDIAVYPEITFGNPLGCNIVARLIMNVPGFFGGPKEFHKSEILWAYDESWNKLAGLNLPESQILCIPTIDIKDFPFLGLKREKKYFYRGKGNQQPVSGLNAENLVDDTWSDSHRRGMLIERLNRAEVLYIYDNHTARNYCFIVWLSHSYNSRSQIY